MTSPPPMRFHWSVPGTGVHNATRGAQNREDINPVTDLDGQRELCRLADAGGIDSLLLPIGLHRADPVTLATSFAQDTSRVTFMAAIRPGIITPTHLVTQLNTVSVLTGGRISVNVVAGYSSKEMRAYGDFRSHDDRFGYSDEFWSICHRLWDHEGPVDFAGEHLRVEGAAVNTPYLADDRDRPELYFGGGSDLAADLAIKHGDTLLRIGDTPERIEARVRRVLAAGKRVGLLMSLVCRPTHTDAVDAAYALVGAAGAVGRGAQDRFRRDAAESVGMATSYALGDEADDWPTPYVWTGAIPYLGPNAIALVGSPDEITDALFAYRRVGVTQFLFHGRPDIEALPYFCAEVLPRVRAREAGAAAMPP